FYANTYATYTGLLATNSGANPTNTVLGSAVANFNNGNGAPGRFAVVETSAQLRANGQTGATGFWNNNGFFVSTWGTIDALILPGVGASKAAAIHEINEAMGAGGAGSMLGVPHCTFDVSTCLGGTDLYRYSANLTPSLSQAAYL